jgi:hypothetical protein
MVKPTTTMTTLSTLPKCSDSDSDSEDSEDAGSTEVEQDDTRDSDAKILSRAQETPYDSELLEIWIETRGGVLRLLSRRAKTPVELTHEVESDILQGVADFMDPEQPLSFEIFRDSSNFPELS